MSAGRWFVEGMEAYSVPCPASARMNVLVNDRVVPEGTAISKIAAMSLTFSEFPLYHGADPSIGTAPIKHPAIDRPLARVIKRMLRARYSLGPPPLQFFRISWRFECSHTLLDLVDPSEQITTRERGPDVERSRFRSCIITTLNVFVVD